MAASVAFCARAEVWNDPDTGCTWNYRIVGGMAEIQKMAPQAYPGHLEIPATLGGKDVAGIGNSAFMNCSNLTSVAIPDGVVNLGNGAFARCFGLERLTMPGSVTNIGMSAFSLCSNLVDVTLPQCACTGRIATVFMSSFQRMTHIALAGGVAVIGTNAFVGCQALKGVDLPEGLTEIGYGAFRNCTNLTGVTIPRSVVKIDDCAFDSCTALSRVSFAEPSSLAWVGDYAFRGCPLSTYSFNPPDAVEHVGRDAWKFDNIGYLPMSIGSTYGLSPGKVYVVSNLIVASTGRLIVPPGTTIKFKRGGLLRVMGVLDVHGTREFPVVFTSARDDTHGGNTNPEEGNVAPEIGDWAGIINQTGTAYLNYANIYYGGAPDGMVQSGISHGMVVARRGTNYLSGCILKHSATRMIGVVESAGRVYAENCILEDADFGIDNHWTGMADETSRERATFVNGIISQCRQGAFGTVVSNSVFWMCTTCAPGSLTVNCLAYSGGQEIPTNWVSYVGGDDAASGMTYGDPLFADPENGDFRIELASPCIDAAGVMAPTNDFYGQPRVTSVKNIPGGAANLADIGIFEVQSRAKVDLVATSVGTDGEVSPGEMLRVSWVVSNGGDCIVAGSWRDNVSLVSANGRTVSLGERNSEGSIPPGGSIVCSGTFMVPALKEGPWFPKVQINTHRDILEGDHTENNAVVGSVPVEIVVAATDVSSAVSGRVSPGVPAVLKLPFNQDTVNRLVRIAVPEGTRVTWGFGFMPQDTLCSGKATVVGDGVAFMVPEGAVETYVVMESDVSAGYTLSTEPDGIAITGVVPAVLPSSGIATLSIDGTGFTPATSVSFTGTRTIPASSVTYVSSDRILAKVDCGMLTPGMRHDLVAVAGVTSARLAAALAVQASPAQPKLSFSIDTPAFVRSGRISSGFVEWHNSGNAEALAPIITLKASNGTALSLTQDGEYSKSAIFIGAGKSAQAGKIMPGETGRQYFFFSPGGGEYNISYSVLGFDWDVKRDSVFTTWKDFAEGLSVAVTRLGLAGLEAGDFTRARDLANKTAIGFDNAMVTGRLFNDAISRPMVGRPVALKDDSGTVAHSAVTGQEGEFAFFDVPKSAGLWLETEDVDGVRRTPISTASGDCLDLVVHSSLRPIAGTVVSAAGYVMQPGAQVELLADGGRIDSATTDSSGGFVFWGVTNDNCIVRVLAHKVFPETEMPVGSGAFDGQIILPTAARIEGRVSFESGHAPPVDLPIILVATDGTTNALMYSASTDANGRFAIPGVQPGEYTISSIERYAKSFEDIKVAATRDETAFVDIAIPSFLPFRPNMSVCFAPCEITFEIDDEAVLASKAFQWDFDADGTIDSTEVAPTTVYAQSGIYDVMLQVQDDEGTWTNYAYSACVEVRENVGTELNEGVRSLSAGDLVSMASENEIVVDEAIGSDCKVGDVLVVPFRDGPAAVKVESIDRGSGGIALRVQAADVTDVFRSVSGVVAKGGAESWFTAKLSEILPQIRNSCPYAPFKISNTIIGELKFPYITIAPEIDGHMAFEVSDGKITMVYFEVARSVSINVGVDFSAGIDFQPINVSKSVELGKFMAGPIPMTVEGSAYVSGGIHGGYDGRFELVSRTDRRGRWFRYDANGPRSGPINERKSNEKTKSAFCPGFAIEAGLGVDVGAGFNFKAVKAKALAIGVKVGLDCSYKKTLRGEFEPDEGQFVLGAGGSITFTPFEAGVGLGCWEGKVAILPQSWPLVRGECPFRVSYSAVPKILSKTIDDKGNARVTTGVDWNDSEHCDYLESINWGDGSPEFFGSSYTHKYETKGFKDPLEVRVVVTQKYKDGLTRDKKAFANLVINPQRCKCGPNCPTCDGDCENCQCGAGGGGGGEGGGGGSSVAGRDPNEMAGPLGKGDPDTQRFVKPGQWMPYTIYFENQTNATAAAQEVFVTNSLSEYLDWSTFEMGEVAFGDQIDLGLAGKQCATNEVTMTGTNLIVRSIVDLDSDKGEVRWYMRVVDPASGDTWPKDVRGGFLPPNNPATHCGEGHLTYRVKVREDAPPGVRIDNSAIIVFDTNDPIETDPAWWNTVAPERWTVNFAEANVESDEGSNVVIRVMGGNADTNSSVKLYLAYNTASAVDLNLGKTKYPVTLTWAAGEVGEKVVTIPVKADALVEGDELLTLQLAAASGMALGEARVCTVRIKDAQWPDVANEEEEETRGLAALPAGATAVYAARSASGPYQEGDVLAGYFTKKDKKGNVTAKALPGYVFVGWTYSNGKTYSTKATIADKTRKSKKVTPKFAVARYVRALADPANGGKTTGSGRYADGKVVTLKATPTKYWSFEGWYRECEEGIVNSEQVGGLGEFLAKSATIKVTATNDATYYATFKPYPKVTVVVDNKAGGTVKGAGSYLAGKTATLKATPKKGYAFTGWVTGDGEEATVLSLATTYKYKVPADGASLTATFKKESELAKPTLTWAETNLTVGVSYSAKLSVVGESVVSITKVTGLPKGLKFKSGKVTGVPTVKKVYTATVTVALASNKKKTWTYKVKLDVAELPAWAVGTFKGTLYAAATGETPPAAKGTVTLTVGKTGKVSGKFVDTKKKSYSFSVGSFNSFTDGVLRTKATMKYGKKSVTVEIAVGQDGETSVGFAEVGSTAAPFSGSTAVLKK